MNIDINDIVSISPFNKIDKNSAIERHVRITIYKDSTILKLDFNRNNWNEIIEAGNKIFNHENNQPKQ